MNKAILAVLLVVAIAGMTYAYPGGYNGEQDEDQQAIQLLNALQKIQETDEEVNQQSSFGKKAKSQWFRKALGIAHGLLGKWIAKARLNFWTMRTE